MAPATPDSTEPILRTDSYKRFTLHPVDPKYKQAYEHYQNAVASFWTTGEVNCSNDETDWKALNSAEQKFILHVLSFFNASDMIVNENLAQRFMSEVQIPEINMFYGFQVGMETIHTDMYGLLLTLYEKDPKKQRALTDAIMGDNSIRLKAEWAMKWIKSSDSFAERLLAFACVEGIFFSASFCAIFYFKKRGKLQGLTFSNELISRDEALHRDFAVYVYSLLEHPLSQERVHEIINDAVHAESVYVEEALQIDLIGMKKELMLQYVKFVADHLLKSLGYEKLYKVENPFDWMDIISMPGKTNFFEKRVGEYAKAGSYVVSKDDNEFALDADF